MAVRMIRFASFYPLPQKSTFTGDALKRCSEVAYWNDARPRSARCGRRFTSGDVEHVCAFGLEHQPWSLHVCICGARHTDLWSPATAHKFAPCQLRDGHAGIHVLLADDNEDALDIFGTALRLVSSLSEHPPRREG
jgi:hypothetical protein